MKSNSYIGVTGFKTPEEVVAVGELFKQNGFPTNDYTAMFGFIASENGLLNPGKEGRVRPALNNLFEAVTKTPDFAIPMIHYFTNNQDLLAQQVIETFQKDNLYSL